MKIVNLQILIVVVIVLCLGAADGTPYYVKKGEKEGYIDEKGNDVIPLRRYDKKQYDFIGREYSEGLVLIRVGMRSAFYDESGKVKVDLGPRYPLVDDKIVDGLVSVKDRNGFGFIDKAGKEVVKPGIRANLASYSSGRVVVHLPPKTSDPNANGEVEVVDLAGRIVIPRGTYSQIYPFREGVAMVYNTTTNRFFSPHGFLDTNGKVLVPLEYQAAFVPSEGVLLAANHHKWTAFDTNGSRLFETEAQICSYFLDGLARAKDKKTGLFGFMDRNGDWSIKPSYKRCGDFSHGLAAVVVGGDKKTIPELESIPGIEFPVVGSRFAFIDRAGKMVLTPDVVGMTADDERPLPQCKGELIQFKDGEKIGYMNRSGNWVWPLSN